MLQKQFEQSNEQIISSYKKQLKEKDALIEELQQQIKQL